MHKTKLDKAIDACSEFAGRPVTRQMILKKSKRNFYCHPRQFVMAYLRTHTDMTYPMIADRLEKKDHTTVMHGVKSAWSRWGDNPKFIWHMRKRTRVLYDTPIGPNKPVFESGAGWRDAA